MIIESFCSRTYAFFSNIESANRGQEVINAVRVNPPAVKFDIQNYHFETRVERRNGNTHVKQVRVNTHHADKPFAFCEWMDISPEASAIDYVKAHRLTRMTFMKHFDYTPQAS